MANAPLRPCAKAGCRNLTRTAYCDLHRPRDAARRSADAAEWHRWYELTIWRDGIRVDQLLREPFCRECSRRALAERRPELSRVRATDVDHITPHRGDWSLFSDPSNLQSLCHACHSRKTAQEMREIFR